MLLVPACEGGIGGKMRNVALSSHFWLTQESIAKTTLDNRIFFLIVLIYTGATAGEQTLVWLVLESCVHTQFLFKINIEGLSDAIVNLRRTLRWLLFQTIMP